MLHLSTSVESLSSTNYPPKDMVHFEMSLNLLSIDGCWESKL